MTAVIDDGLAWRHTYSGDSWIMNTNQWRPLAGLLCLVLFMSACSGATATSLSDAATESLQESSVEGDDSASASGDVTRFEGHGDIQLFSGFIPELADLPVPEVAALQGGAAYDASQDPRETAIQRLDFLLEPAEVVAFYLEEMSALGYSLTSDSYPQNAAELAEYTADGVESFVLIFEGPDGTPTQLLIDPANTGGNTTMNINRFRSGSR